MAGHEEELYRRIINDLRTTLIDLDYCFASIKAKDAVSRAIDICEADLATRLKRDPSIQK